MTRLLCALASLSFFIITASHSLAHHGWSWTTGANIDLTGIIKSAKLGNPHGIVSVDVEGVTWTIEVGQPWRNERAGLADADFTAGNKMRFVGEPSADTSQKLMKAERIYIGDKEFKLYPDRD